VEKNLSSAFIIYEEANKKKHPKNISDLSKTLKKSCPTLDINHVTSHTLAPNIKHPTIIITRNEKLILSEKITDIDVSELISIANWRE
jgi:hypothetical protein